MRSTRTTPPTAPSIRTTTGYTNLEEFLNTTDPIYIDYTNPANNRFSWDIE